MSNTYVNMVREELQASKCTVIQRVKLEEAGELIRRSMFKLPLITREGRRLFVEMLTKMAGDAELLGRLRVAKIALGSHAPEDSYDREVLEIVESLVELEKEALSPVSIRYHDKRLVVFEKDCVVNGEKYRRGDLALLTVNELTAAFIHRCVKPLQNPLVAFSKSHG